MDHLGLIEMSMDFLMQVHVRAVAVGPLASVWILSDDGCLWLRLGVSWQNSSGHGLVACACATL